MPALYPIPRMGVAPGLPAKSRGREAESGLFRPRSSNHETFQSLFCCPAGGRHDGHAAGERGDAAPAGGPRRVRPRTQGLSQVGRQREPLVAEVAGRESSQRTRIRQSQPQGARRILEVAARASRRALNRDKEPWWQATPRRALGGAYFKKERI